MREIRRRTRIFVATGTLVVLVVAGCSALFVERGLSSLANHNANVRARSGVALLVSVGSRIPRLTPARLTRGLTGTESHSLDLAVERGQRAGLLANLNVWDRTGRIVYSPEAQEGTRPPLELEVREALDGQHVTRVHATELDASSGRHTGVLDAFEPLRDDEGRVYGAVETSIPLAPIKHDTGRISQRVTLTLVGAALLLWLLALPLVIPTARAAAERWVPGRRRALAAFRRALERGEIEMVYQPQIDPATGGVVALEALVRWRRSGVLQAPGSFLPVVESSALMPALTDRALALALAQVRRCDEAGHHVRMSVNCSANDLSDRAFCGRIASALEGAGVAGERLTLELTETAILDDPVAANALLASIRELGVDIAVDDFGTGHASIARLHSLPVSEVKIDKSFMTSDDHSRAYVRAIISFAQELGLRVVAEGVEDDTTLQLLREHNCNLAQGYLIARPMTSPDLAVWLDDRSAVALPNQPMTTSLN